jgi:thymidylate synthase (FAD)
MKIMKPSFIIEERDELRGGLKIIEKAARTCYKTEDRITEDSAEKMVRSLRQRQHYAMLEHGDYIFTFTDYHLYDIVVTALRRLMEDTGNVPLLAFTNIDERPIISGNIRAWRELIASGSAAAYYFTGLIDPIYTEDLIPPEDRCEDSRVRQLRYADLVGEVERRTHLRQTVRFVVDRGVSHEFVRHRVMSFAQESTRWCNYSGDKFGREISVIEPSYLQPETEAYNLWKRQCMSAETAYFHLLNMGLLPQDARDVLPHSAKAELMLTGTLGAWNHFFDLRA